jgi:hypothetical protein
LNDRILCRQVYCEVLAALFWRVGINFTRVEKVNQCNEIIKRLLRGKKKVELFFKSLLGRQPSIRLNLEEFMKEPTSFWFFSWKNYINRQLLFFGLILLMCRIFGQKVQRSRSSKPRALRNWKTGFEHNQLLFKGHFFTYRRT